MKQQNSDTASGWAGWALALLEFGSSVNPITTRGTDYVHLKVSLLGVDSLWGDCTFIPADWGSYTQYPFIRNDDQAPPVGFLKNSPVSDSQRFLIFQV